MIALKATAIFLSAFVLSGLVVSSLNLISHVIAQVAEKLP